MATTSLRFDISALDRASDAFEKIGDAVDRLVAKLAALDKMRVRPKVEVDVDQAQLIALQARLRSLRNRTVRVEVRTDASQIAAVGARTAALRDKTINIRIRLHGISQAIARLTALDAIVRRLDGRNINIDVDVDAAGAIAQVGAIETSLGALRGSIGSVGTSSRTAFGGMSRMALMAAGGLVLLPPLAAGIAVAGAGITAAWGGISTAIAAIGPAVMLLAAPVSAVALGVDGIKKAAQTLRPEFEALQALLNTTFERGMLPVFEKLRAAFPALTEGLHGTAHAVIGISMRLAEMISSEPGIARIKAIFDNVNTTLNTMSPGIAAVVDGFLILGSQTSIFDALALAVNTFGTEFRTSVIDLVSDGTLDAAMAGLGGSLAALTRGFVSLVENGIRVFAAAAPGVNAAIDSITGFFNRFDWGSLGSSVGGVFRGIADGINSIPTGTIRAIEREFAELSAVFQSGEMQAGIRAIADAIPGAISLIGDLSREFASIAQAVGPAITAFADFSDEFSTFASNVQTQAESLGKSLGLQGPGSLGEALGNFDQMLDDFFGTGGGEQRGSRGGGGKFGSIAADVQALGAAVNALPASKTITIAAPSAPATTGMLQSLGLSVEAIPNTKDVRITAPTEAAKANLDAFVAGANSASAIVPINGNPMPAQQALTAILTAVAGGAESVTINGNPMPAQAALAFALGMISSGKAEVTIGAQSFPAQEALSAFIAATNAGSGTVTIQGQDFPAQSVLSALIAAVTGANPEVVFGANAAEVDAAKGQAEQDTQSTHTIDPNAAPAQGAITGLQAPTASTHTVTVNDGAVQAAKAAAAAPTSSVHHVFVNDGAVQAAKAGAAAPTSSVHHIFVNAGALQAAKAAASVPTASVHTIQVNAAPVTAAIANARLATQSLHTLNANDSAVVSAKSRAMQPTSSMHTINVNDGAVRAAKAAASRPTSSTHTIHVRVVGGGVPRADGAYTMARAEGAYTAAAYAQGGMRKMSGARAEIVPPRQPRVIGDRQVNDEAFIPINGSVRSRAILQTAANQMGMNVTPMANGGVLSAVRAAVSGGGVRGGDGWALLDEMRQLNGQLRALRGDVDHHSDNASIAARLDVANRLLSRLGSRAGSAAARAQTDRTTADLGAF